MQTALHILPAASNFNADRSSTWKKIPHYFVCFEVVMQKKLKQQITFSLKYGLLTRKWKYGKFYIDFIKGTTLPTDVCNISINKG